MEQAKAFIHNPSPEAYVFFMQEVHTSYSNKSAELTNKIVNKWRNVEKKEVKSKLLSPGKAGEGKFEGGEGTSGQGRKPVSCVPKPLNAKPKPSGAETPSGEGTSGTGSKLVSCVPEPVHDKRKPTGEENPSGTDGWNQEDKVSSKFPKPWQKSAWKTGFIFRGDKVPTNGKLFLDVEKVALKLPPGENTHQQKAATVCLVNEDGKVVLWALIKISHHDICQYCYQITNLTPRKLDIGVDLSMIHQCLDLCLQGNVVVGAAILNDFKSLDYKFSNVLELQDFFRDDKGPFALGHIARYLLNARSGFQKGHHTAIDDARMTLRVYKHYTETIQCGTFDGDLGKLSATRKPYKDSRPKYFAEKCRCK